MKLSEQSMRDVLDRLVERPSITGAAAVIGASSKLIFFWIKKSADEKAVFDAGEIFESKYQIRWPLDEDGNGDLLFFSDAVKLALKMFSVNLDLNSREIIDRGTKRMVMEGGKPVYETDHLLTAQFEGDADAARAMGFKDPFFVHDASGARIPMYVWDNPAAALKIHGLRSLLPLFNPETKVDTTQTINGGVLVLHGNAEKPKSELREDLETRLARLRQRPISERPVPEGKVEVFSPRDEPMQEALPPPVPTLRDHPRAYQAPKPPEPKPQSYARPQPPPQSVADYSGVGRGVPLSGGFKVR
jgi:hypothetical protein